MLSLSERIRRERECRHWSQSELAARIGVSESTIRRWESGEREPYPYHRYLLQAVLGIPYGTRERRAERMKRMDKRADTYFVFDSHQQEEYLRLHTQSEMVSRMLGGAIPEQSRAGRFRDVLDVGCGTGYWLIDCARTHPRVQKLIGIDINTKSLGFAQVQAKQANVDDRVQFRQGDALQGLDYPDASFDLVGLRFGVSWVRVWDWPKLLREMYRVLRPGGVVRMVDAHMLNSTSDALNRFWGYGAQAARQAGLLVQDEDSMVKVMPRYLAAASFTNILSKYVPATYRPDTPEFALFAEDVRRLLEHSAPFLQKWINVDDYQQLAEDVRTDLSQADVEASWPLEIIWATKP